MLVLSRDGEGRRPIFQAIPLHRFVPPERSSLDAPSGETAEGLDAGERDL